VNRIKRVREACPDLLGPNGWRWRVLRTSNAYSFNDPSPAADRPISSKSEKPSGTEPKDSNSDLLEALDRLQEGIRGGQAQDPDRRAVT
jgi:hypothetical protein